MIVLTASSLEQNRVPSIRVVGTRADAVTAVAVQHWLLTVVPAVPVCRACCCAYRGAHNK